MQQNGIAADKVFLLDKPKTWTSFDLTRFLKKIAGVKAGHAGTLDPLATGLMIVCTGKMTKKVDYFQGLDKTYSGTICLGATTPSFDLETEEDSHSGVAHLSLSLLEALAGELKGTYEQTAPVFSAKKIDGKRAYHLARAGKEVKIKSHLVKVEEFSLSNLRFEGEKAYVDFFVACSKGTYIRSLARDLGIKSGAGGYLTELRRLSIGPYQVERSFNIEELRALFPKNPAERS
jgi:tRNA pseudouridine55 synthase